MAKKLQPMKCDNVKLSKALSWLLRHGAHEEGFKFEEGGFLYIDDILKHPTFQTYSLGDVEAVVKSDAKGRFTLQTCPKRKVLQIRANQGHSVEVEKLELTPIVEAQLAPVVVHGTYTRYWKIIKNEGLSRMTRNHIHFSSALPNSSEVISGIRQSCDVFIYINIAEALKDGILFFRSTNNVILSPGDEHGIIPPKYFEKVEHKSRN